MVKGKKRFLYKELQQKVSSKVEMNPPDNFLFPQPSSLWACCGDSGVPSAVGRIHLSKSFAMHCTLQSAQNICITAL